MKIRSMNIWSVVLATTIVGCWATASNGAEQPPRDPNDSDLNLVPTQNVQSQPVYQQMQQMKQIQGRAEIAAKALAGARPRTNLAGSIRTAAEAVRDAKGDEAKAAAQKTLSDLLGKYFDEDTKRRQEELTQIEERLAKLRELLERRRSKKQDILELQMKVALNEADGLGFYDSEHSAGPKVSNSFLRTTTDSSPFTWSDFPTTPVGQPPLKKNSGTESSQIPR